jgi:hypothetical protein
VPVDAHLAKPNFACFSPIMPVFTGFPVESTSHGVLP